MMQLEVVLVFLEGVEMNMWIVFSFLKGASFYL